MKLRDNAAARAAVFTALNRMPRVPEGFNPVAVARWKDETVDVILAALDEALDNEAERRIDEFESGLPEDIV